MPQWTSSLTLDWYRALAVPERLAQHRARPASATAHDTDTARGTQRLARWRAEAPFTTDDWWHQRLAGDHASDDEWLTLLGEASEARSAALDDVPAWATALEHACASPATVPVTATLSEKWQTHPTVRFLEAFAPLIQPARARVAAQCARLLQTYPEAPCTATTLATLLDDLLPGQLLPLLTRTMILELHVARVQGVLHGDTAEARFASFLQHISQLAPRTALLQEYPVLGRLVVEGLERWVTVSSEVAHRLCADWQAIQQVFAPSEPPGPVVSITGGAGDTHRGGRSVMIVTWRSGFRLVYKPKSLAIDQHFQQLLQWVNAWGAEPPLRPLTVLDRGTYGWVAYIQAASCTTPEEVQRFYQRQGSYLALFYALAAADLHHENLIAAGEHPYPIDLEAVFHPQLPAGMATPLESPLSRVLGPSVLRSGLLPQRLWAGNQAEGVDISGLGGAPGQHWPGTALRATQAGTDTMHLTPQTVALAESQNRPKLRDQAVDLVAYQDALLTGFTTMYRLLWQHREALLADDGPLACCAEDEVRVLLRPTRTYGTVLHAMHHPDMLRDALERDRLVDRLWAEVPSRPYLQHAVQAECAALRAGDIPLFTTPPTSRRLWSGDGAPIDQVCAASGMELVQQQLQRFSEADLQQQIWLIRASLSTVPKTAHHVPQARPPASTSLAPVTPADLLVQASAIGARLDALALREGEDVAWLGITLAPQAQYWSLAPLGVALYDGLPGVALFLAYLGAITDNAPSQQLAATTWETLRRLVEQHPEMVTSIGAYNGWGGLIYTLTHLATLWEQPRLLDEAEQMVARLPELIARDEALDVIGGAAGCLGSLLALYHVRPTAQTLAVALQCGERLLATAQPMAHGIGWQSAWMPQALAGFAHGAAGMAWALLRLARVTGMARFATAAQQAIAYERSLFVAAQGNWSVPREFSAFPQRFPDGPPCLTAWCHGAPGIGLGRLTSLPRADDAAMQQDLAVALATTATHGMRGNHSLCHGDLGNLELLLEAQRILGHDAGPPTLPELTAQLLHDIRTHGWRCGNPLGVESPGLMTGLAGIGYGLLRLAAPTRVPSVLALAPPRTVWVSHAISGLAALPR